jgi:hypothetical protein
LSDGRKATNLDEDMGRAEDDTPPEGPVLMHAGGGGGANGDSVHDYWLWPLPPPGKLVVVCEWPAFGIPETSAEIEAELILEAADRARAMWPEQ